MDAEQQQKFLEERKVNHDKTENIDHTTREECAFEGEANTTECQTEEGRHVVDQFYRNLPDPNEVKEWYAGFTPEGYNEWARVVNFTEPYHIIDNCCKNTAEGGLQLDRSAVCLDIGSGTGIVGQAMQNAGFTNLQALDVSDNFLDACRERGFYTEYHNFFLGKGVDQFPENLKNTFDVVTASGVWMPGHMPKEALLDVHAALKVGGVLVTAMRMSMWTDGNHEAYKEYFEEQFATGKLEVVKEERFLRGTVGGKGLFAQQESILLVIQKKAE